MSSSFTPQVILFNTPHEYGAIGDGITHPLSGIFGSLAQAQANYSFPITGCSYSAASTTVACADATFLDPGYPISGLNIPTGATVSSVTDSTHFVLSVNPIGSGSGVSLTSSYITSLSQEIDYAGMQKCVWTNGSMFLPSGTYLLGASTLKIKSASFPAGITVLGDGPRISELIAGVGVDAIRVMQGYTKLQDFSIQYLSTPSGIGSTGSGVFLDTNIPESVPPRYTFNWNIDRVYFIGFANGIYNPYKWDEGRVSNCEFRWCGADIKTSGNLDTLIIRSSNTTAHDLVITLTGGATTNGSPTITCASTSGIIPGMLVVVTGLTDAAAVKSVDSITQITLTENASASNTGLTIKVYSIGLWVDSNGRAKWDGGVMGNGYAIYGSGNAGAIITAEDIHLEGTAGVYARCPSNGSLQLLRNFTADAGSQFLAWAEPGASVFIEGAYGQNSSVFSNGRTDVRAVNCISAIDVNWNNAFHYTASPYHVAINDESPGWPFWPTAPAVGYIVYQTGASFPFLTWQYLRLSDGSLAWRIINVVSQTGDNSLPTPSAAYRGVTYLQAYDSVLWPHPDQSFTCMDIAGAYYWVRSDGLVADTSGTAIVITPHGTTGEQTINFYAGSVNIAASTASIKVNNTLVNTSSVIIATVATNDATLTSVQCVPAIGSFTMYPNALATAETRIQFRVINE